MEPISYFNTMLADPHITMVQMLHMQRPVVVARLYVPLRLAEIRQQGFDASLSEEVVTEESRVSISIQEERQRRERNPEVIYDPEKAIHTFQRGLIIGDSGAGKTTLLRYLAIVAAQRSSAGISTPLALYVELPFFARSRLARFTRFCLCHLGKGVWVSRGRTAWIARQLSGRGQSLALARCAG